MGFKEDEDFARYLTMGAHAAGAVAMDLESRGHKIIELERYARANKVWSIKVKRLRLPDLLCIRCGQRFESKGKSKLEFRLSHSSDPGREWWSGGMRETDVFAFVRVSVADSIQVGRIVYVTRGALEAAAALIVEGRRKARSEGLEVDVSWPAWAPGYDGAVVKVAPDGTVQTVNAAGRLLTYRRGARWPTMYLYVGEGEKFAEGDLVAGCVAPADVSCAGTVWDWQGCLESDDLDERFAAVKAARWRGPSVATRQLRALLDDATADWRLRLEAAGSLCDQPALEWLQKKVLDKSTKPAERMEGVFILSELDAEWATNALVQIALASSSVEPEVRAAAVWGLGLGARPDPVHLIPFLADPDSVVALHAAAALPDRLPDDVVTRLLAWLTTGQLRQSTVAAHVLARHGRSADLLRAVEGRSGPVRAIALLAVADFGWDSLPPLDLLDQESRVVLETLWARSQDWLRAPATDGGLDVLAKQRLRA